MLNLKLQRVLKWKIYRPMLKGLFYLLIIFKFTETWLLKTLQFVYLSILLVLSIFSLYILGLGISFQTNLDLLNILGGLIILSL